MRLESGAEVAIELLRKKGAFGPDVLVGVSENGRERFEDGLDVDDLDTKLPVLGQSRSTYGASDALDELFEHGDSAEDGLRLL